MAIKIHCCFVQQDKIEAHSVLYYLRGKGGRRGVGGGGADKIIMSVISEIV